MVVEVIQRCPRLESLSLPVYKSDKDDSLIFRSITQHDTLQRLHLNTLPYPNAVTDRLTLPALTDLSLQAFDRDPSMTMSEVEAKICCSQLIAFFTRSTCKLQEFALCHSDFGPRQFLDCLRSHRSCQTLTHLEIARDKYSPPMVVSDVSELLVCLTYPDDDGEVPLCPQLRHLTFVHCYCLDRSFPDLLGRMILSRCFGRTQDAQLRSLHLYNNHCRDSISREDRELLKFAQSNYGLRFWHSYSKF
ncbi:hypothetical protein M378DRAFT_160085 [Amanita muscaria Koide BX008]|uniref:Uncharacterized protein n=1 Tax=Amanita muscaria (strain Koide BX008) TaxID=946122 RepID=A0A0C2XCI8_AMAMK|nr:hypothetical protein M378DRAFT_160085 [Amanita muscaria Koide BX008]